MPFKNKPVLYTVWQSMKRRCDSPNNRQYVNYGGRGIRVCNRWIHDYRAFESDMGPRPTDKHTLDRIDNDGDYTPENCRWATRSEQQVNQRRTRKVTIDGTEYIARDLALLAGVKTDTIVARVNRGLSYDNVISKDKIAYIPTPEDIQKAVDANRRRMAKRTHCKHGHEYTNENTYISKEGWRCCRACHRNRERVRNACS